MPIISWGQKVWKIYINTWVHAYIFGLMTNTEKAKARLMDTIRPTIYVAITIQFKERLLNKWIKLIIAFV